MKKVSISLIAILIISALPAQAQTYSFKVKYGMVNAGAAKLVHQVKDGILKSSLVIESSPWLSNLWTLSDSIISEYRIETARLEQHTKAIHEGKYHRNYRVSFDDSNKVDINGKVKVVETEGLTDIPSLLFELSRTKFIDDDTLNYHIWDGRGHGVLNLHVEKTGKPKLFKPFAEQGWKLTPLNSSKKSRENKIQMSMLYSKSYPHKPLRIEISTKYGNVIMRLENP